MLGVSNLSMARSRAGSLAVFHLVPLTLTPQLSMGAKLIGLSLGYYRRIHSTVGLMACFQSILHVILAYQSVSLDLNNRAQGHGFMYVASSPFFTLNSWLTPDDNFYCIVDIDGYTVGLTTII